MESTTTEERRWARSENAVFDARTALIGFTMEERDEWARDRNEAMLKLVESGYTIGCVARASGYAVSRVSDYVQRAREARKGAG